MTKLVIETSAKVGERITKFVTTAAHTATELHNIMVQCALHAQQHGDVSLAERLINELMANSDEKLKGAAAINVAGIRFWFGTFTPMQMRGSGPYKLTLLEKDSDGYSKYLERGTKAFGKPDEPVQRSGNRVFWVNAGDERPFWDMNDVKSAQRQNVRPIGVSTLIGNVLKLNTDFSKALEAGLIPLESVETAKAFVELMSKAARDFRADHAAELLDEPEHLTQLKLAKEKEAVSDANKGVPKEQQAVEVGGLALPGDEAPNQATGTNG